MTPLLIALQFLTRIPVPLASSPTPQDSARALPCYPLVGLIIGLLLVALAVALQAKGGLGAALVLAAWVWLTGGLHLDGLADSADAWKGGAGERERTLAIMKDPNAGPAGVVAIVLVLLTKYAALIDVITSASWPGLIAAPVLGRAALPLLFLTTPYVRPGGLGAALARIECTRAAWWSIALTGMGLVAAMGETALWMMLASGALFAIGRASMLSRIGGTTGDTAGALVEGIETAALATLAFV